MRKFLVLVALGLPLLATACNDPNAEKLRQTLKALDEAGYAGEGTLEFDGDPNLYAKESIGMGGRFLFRAQLRKVKDSNFRPDPAPSDVKPDGTTTVN